MTVSVVVLTMGDRPAELERAIASIRSQDSPAEVVLVANGCAPGSVDGVDRLVTSADNVGVPAGRNLGWREATGDVVCFLDDDAEFADTAVLSGIVQAFAADPNLAVVSCRIVDESGRSQRHHVPRFRTGDPERSGEVAVFLGGACAIRRSALAAVGGFPDEFFYAHEEADVAWALIDDGHRIEYRGDLVVRHPRVAVGRHPETLFRTARNRVWLARRRLPFPLSVVHVVVRFVLSLVLVRRPADLGALVRGTWQGLSVRPAPARKIRWSSVWRMTRLGRPPIL